VSTESLNHHGSHRDLLWAPTDPVTRQRGIDAIIVPTMRHPANLEGAARLALALECTLVTLHSKEWTSAARAAQRLPLGLDLIAIDVPDMAQLRLPEWKTSRLLHGTVFARRTDISTKRNLGLVLSRLLGWSRILFLDDDITGLNPADVRRASGLLDTHSAVGLHVGGFPDHSVVCHAYRQAGGKQQAFIGGGALAVQVERSNSFFPDIYNEDWFFLLNEKRGLQPVAVTGQVLQDPYDPFRNADRARAEELGDVLAEGIYWLLDQDVPFTEADQAHWGRFLVKRKQFINHVLGMVQQDGELAPDERARRVVALKGSLGRLAHITPGLCENYLRAWMVDRQRWNRHLQKLHGQRRPFAGQRLHAVTALSRPGRPHLRVEMRTPDRGPAKPPRPPAPRRDGRPMPSLFPGPRIPRAAASAGSQAGRQATGPLTPDCLPSQASRRFTDGAVVF